ECVYCKAMLWRDELLRGKLKSPTSSMCCNGGKIKLPPMGSFPTYLHSLFNSNSNEATFFKKNIRLFNCAFSMTSFGASVGFQGFGSFTIHGKICHRIGSLLPEDGQQPLFSQVYIFDPDIELHHR